jgi:hypothetical protein
VALRALALALARDVAALVRRIPSEGGKVGSWERFAAVPGAHQDANEGRELRRRAVIARELDCVFFAKKFNSPDIRCRLCCAADQQSDKAREPRIEQGFAGWMEEEGGGPPAASPAASLAPTTDVITLGLSFGPGGRPAVWAQWRRAESTFRVPVATLPS